ncbi:MAG TPA: glycine betaine ABC transporter substrate-binding protein [Gemmataceae bacterium]|nr:glycine betaine ABC transporter substrate-binding protein [Gemmataceae bacterium]
MRFRWLFVVLLAAGCTPPPEIRIGSKQQPESEILGEMATLLADSTGARAEHRRSLGGTRVLWNALVKGDIDAYPEYTGTISAEILVGSGVRTVEAIRTALAERGMGMSLPLGFNDTYAIGMRKDLAARLGVTRISDLQAHPELKFGFSSEFMNRADGWPGLRQRYQLPQQDVRGLNHDLAYAGLISGTLDATDLYSTDPKICRYDLRVLADDRGYFPAYQAVFVYRADLRQRAPAVVAAILRLENCISEAAMIDMNARVEEDKQPESQVAADFLSRELNLSLQPRLESRLGELGRHTREHIYLVSVSLAAAIVLAVPFGILAARWPIAGQGMLAAAGIIQTIPSLALLVFMIPFLGIGTKPAIAALFLYSLLPIAQNTYTGLQGIPGQIRESAAALGLPVGARLRLVELPLAASTILAGIKTAAVINVGTATLGGFIGAGGYGQVIFDGIPRGDYVGLIVWGAFPAALLALMVLGLFEVAERLVVPKGLRLTME